MFKMCTYLQCFHIWAIMTSTRLTWVECKKHFRNTSVGMFMQIWKKNCAIQLSQNMEKMRNFYQHSQRNSSWRVHFNYRESKRQFTKLSHMGINTCADYNSAICAVMLQLKIPKHVKSNVIWHMIACHMFEEYKFYYPKWKLLEAQQAFVQRICHVCVQQKYLGRLIYARCAGKNVPYQNKHSKSSIQWCLGHFPWECIPTCCNHFQQRWFWKKTQHNSFLHYQRTGRQVEADDNVGKMGAWTGFESGLDRTVDVFYEKEKRKLLKEVRQTFANVKHLCEDLSDLCIWRDKIYDEVQKIGIKVQSFKQLGKFYYNPLEETEETETAHKTLTKQKKSKHHKSEKSKTAPRSCGKFSQELSANILSETVSQMDKGLDTSKLSDQSAVEEILRSQPGGCHLKNVRRLEFPSLLKNADILDFQDEPLHTVTTVKDLKQWGTSTKV